MHYNLTYAIIRTPRHPGLFVVAKDRLSALDRILGSRNEIEVLSEIPGVQLAGLRYRGIFSSSSAGDAHVVHSTPDPTHRHTLQVILASHVTSDTGTGLVHCAPAHGSEDYHAFRSLLDSGMLCHVDAEGKFCSSVKDIVGPLEADLVGLEVLKEGSKAIVRLLGQTKSLLAVEKFRHRYPYDWKTDEPVIVT